MKRNRRRMSGWIVVAVIALSVGLIGADERVPPEGPLALLYAQIHALFVETGLLAAESNDQQEQIDHLTSTVCELSVLTGNPAPPELCEVVVTAVCAFIGETASECSCDPGPFFELESCESVQLVSCYPGSFSHPDFGEDTPPKCDTVNACRGTFTRTAAGDVGSIVVDPNCTGGRCPPGGRPCPDGCQCVCTGCDCIPIPFSCS